MGDIKLADWGWLPFPRLVWSAALGFGSVHLTPGAVSKDVAQWASPEQPYFHGRFPFKYLTDREHGAIKASRGPGTGGGNGQIKPPMGEEGGEWRAMLPTKSLRVGPALKSVPALVHSWLHTQNNLVSLQQKQDLSSITYGPYLTFFLMAVWGHIPCVSAHDRVDVIT